MVHHGYAETTRNSYKNRKKANTHQLYVRKQLIHLHTKQYLLNFLTICQQSHIRSLSEWRQHAFETVVGVVNFLGIICFSYLTVY